VVLLLRRLRRVRARARARASACLASHRLFVRAGEVIRCREGVRRARGLCHSVVRGSLLVCGTWLRIGGMTSAGGLRPAMCSRGCSEYFFVWASQVGIAWAIGMAILVLSSRCCWGESRGESHELLLIYISVDVGLSRDLSNVLGRQIRTSTFKFTLLNITCESLKTHPVD
jgi:hypothetical protein